VKKPFGVHWPNSQDARLTWELDGDPTPVLPADAILRAWVLDGMTRAGPVWRIPRGGVTGRRIHTYWYRAVVPFAGTADEAAAMADQAAELLEAVPDTLHVRWRRDWKPRILAHLHALDNLVRTVAADPAGPVAREALSAFDDHQRALWTVHFEIVWPLHWVLREFEVLTTDLVPDEPALAATLTASETSLTRLTRLGFRRLARAAVRLGVADPVVAAVEDRQDPWARLDATMGGRRWRRSAERFLRIFGKKLGGPSVSAPSWIEDPRPVFAAVAAELDRPRDNRRDPAAIRKARDRAEARMRRHLSHYPRPVVAEWERWLPAARRAARLLEDHNFYIDQESSYYLRQLLGALSDRVASAGSLVEPDDVFYLDWGELAELVDGGRRDWGPVINARRAEMSEWRTVSPPKRLGEGSPPASYPHPLMGHAVPPPAPPGVAPDALIGQAASPGRVTGRVRVIRTLAEAAALRPGEILVTASPTPAWAPWYQIAAAVVTDGGGVLSHAGIVAREYGIPAVVAVGNATARLVTGDAVEVDGDAGMIRRLHP
jgi:phosphohistidine swiveling domain-containing protein